MLNVFMIIIPLSKTLINTFIKLFIKKLTDANFQSKRNMGKYSCCIYFEKMDVAFSLKVKR